MQTTVRTPQELMVAGVVASHFISRSFPEFFRATNSYQSHATPAAVNYDVGTLVGKLLAGNAMVCSMSRRADCWDNAVAESFFATLKKELVHRVRFATRREAEAAIFEYIEVFYNRQRKHSTLGYTSPVDYRQNNTALTSSE